METTWKETADLLRSRGWVVEYKPIAGLPPYVWRSPRGVSGTTYRSSHHDAPPEAVMQDAYSAGEVEYTWLIHHEAKVERAVYEPSATASGK